METTYLEFRESPSNALVLSDEVDFRPGSMAERLFAAARLATPRPVALDMVLDLVMPRFLGEVGVLALSPLDTVGVLLEVLELMPPVLGREDGVLPDILDSLLALMVAASTVFCLLKLEPVV